MSLFFVICLECRTPWELKAVRVVFIVCPVSEFPGCGIISIQAKFGTYPDRTILVLNDRGNFTTAQGIWIIGIRPEHMKGIAVKAIQAILCADPQKAESVLEKHPGGTLGKTFLQAVMHKAWHAALVFNRGECVTLHGAAGNGDQ